MGHPDQPSGAADLPAGLDIPATISDLDCVIRSAFIRATKPGPAGG